MASKSLTFDLFGRDVSASKAMRGVGNTAETMGSKFKRAGIVVGAGLAAVGVAAVKFGMDSVKAYSEAAEQQNKLAFAFKKFPALADTNQKALQRLNSELQNKTRFDDDDLAGAQSVLAQYKLTGAQIKELTPLLADYAQKTGKDLPSAATDLGKAMLGQGRGLKAIGANFKDTGDLAGNYAELVGILNDKVGGFAEQAGSTAAGKLQILQNKFGDLQESVGEKLTPVLTGLVDYGNDHLLPFLDELGQSKGIDDFFGTIEKHAKNGDVVGFLDPAAWGNGLQQIKDFFNNGEVDPAGTGGPLDPEAWGHGLDQIRQALSDFNAVDIPGGPLDANAWQNGWDQIVEGVSNNIAVIKSTVNGGQVDPAGTGGPLDPAAWQHGWDQVISGFGNGLQQIKNALNNGRVDPKGTGGPLDPNAWQNGWNQIQGFFTGHPLQLVTTIVWRNTDPPVALSGLAYGQGKRAFAKGGIVRARPGGIDATVAEGGVDEAILPLTRGNLNAIGEAAAGGRGGTGGGININVNVTGIVAGSASQVSKFIYTAVVDGMKRGDIPRNALTV